MGKTEMGPDMTGNTPVPASSSNRPARRTSAVAKDSAGYALRVDGLAKSFGATKALREATFGLKTGEVHAIVGENGSGKSTLVKILSGVHRPDAGELQIG